MRSADPSTPVPPHLSDEERALWETPERCVFERATVRALLTALSTEREAGERYETVRHLLFISADRSLEGQPSVELPAHITTVDEAVDFLTALTTRPAAPSTETPHD